MLPLLAALAVAQDLPLPAPEPPVLDGPWGDTYQAGMNTARVGAILGGVGTASAGAGFVLLVGGLLTGSEGAFAIGGVGIVGGGVAVLVGAPLMAGGSLRAARALEDGGYTVTRWPGYTSWALWGGSFALTLAAPLAATDDADASTLLSTLGGMAFLGSYAMGGTQMVINGATYRGAPSLVYVGPMPMKDGAGASLALRF